MPVTKRPPSDTVLAARAVRAAATLERKAVLAASNLLVKEKVRALRAEVKAQKRAAWLLEQNPHTDPRTITSEQTRRLYMKAAGDAGALSTRLCRAGHDLTAQDADVLVLYNGVPATLTEPEHPTRYLCLLCYPESAWHDNQDEWSELTRRAAILCPCGTGHPTFADAVAHAATLPPIQHSPYEALELWNMRQRDVEARYKQRLWAIPYEEVPINASVSAQVLQ